MPHAELIQRIDMEMLRKVREAQAPRVQRVQRIEVPPVEKNERLACSVFVVASAYTVDVHIVDLVEA